MPNYRLLLTFLLGFVTFSIGWNISASAQTTNGSIKVKLLEKGTSEPIPGALIYHQKKIFVTDNDGICTLPNVHGSSLTLTVKSMSFQNIKDRTFKLKPDQTLLIIYMKPEATEIQGVTVTSTRRQTTVLQQTSKISGEKLERSASISVAKVLEKVPGVSMISTGNTIAKPVIQGMHSSRILLINNGVRLESQSWGDDHAPEIDHTGSDVVEVIKGAESIRYGYGAIGGVVLFNNAPLPYGHDKLFVSGKLNTGFDTNAKGFDATGTIDLGYKNFGLRLHTLGQKAGDYRTADYVLNNTGFRTISHSGLFGYRNNAVTATLYSSLYYSRSGLYYASKISDLNQLLLRFAAGRPEEESIYPFSYTIKPPFQQTQHFMLKAEVKWDINKQHDVTFKATYQDNLRQEFENRKKDELSWLPVQDLQLTSMGAEGVWNARWGLWGMASQVGANASYQYNYNVPGTKQPAFVPNYAALTVGYFLMHKATIDKLQLSTGMRYDVRAMDVNGYTTLSSFNYYEDFKMFYNFTSNVAAHYQFNNQWDARANIGWSWRPPDINELYAIGLNHGTYWVVGNRNLTAERGYKAILGTRYRSTWLTVEPSVFYQRINNYIYDAIGTGDRQFYNHPSGKYPQFFYEQDNARFYGSDISGTINPVKNLFVTASGEWIFARNLSHDTWLPFMPADRYTLEANYKRTFGRNKKWEMAFSLEGVYVTKQKRFDPQKDLVPETPPAYTLLNGHAEVKYNLPHNRSVKFLITGDNMLNSLYKDYTDRFRYYAHSRGAQFSIRTVVNF